MTTRSYYQSSEIDGYTAEVRIKWSMPDDVDPKDHEGWKRADDIADEALTRAGPKMREIVQAMRGNWNVE
jgi:hypothetical protein